MSEPGTEIPGLKLIKLNSSRIDNPDDPSFPFKMELICRPPEFMNLAFILLCGPTEDVVMRAMTKEALDKFIENNNLRRHPRLMRLTITGPTGVLEKIER